jgi:hypothetical protein
VASWTIPSLNRSDRLRLPTPRRPALDDAEEVQKLPAKDDGPLFRVPPCDRADLLVFVRKLTLVEADEAPTVLAQVVKPQAPE